MYAGPAVLSSPTLSTAAPSAARTPSRPDTDFRKVGDEIVAKVRDHFYDSARAAAWAVAHAGYAADIHDARTFADRTNALLDELKTSHTHYYSALDVDYYGLAAIFQRALKIDRVLVTGIGADFLERPEGYYVRTLLAGGPAEQAGLLRGDRVLTADGRPFDPYASFKGRGGLETTLQIQRRPDAAPFQVRVTPRTVNPREEWLEAQRQGSRIIERAGKKIAYAPMFSCAGEAHQEALLEAMNDRFHEADALVLDFRNGWGGCNPEFVHLFDPYAPTLTSIPRDGLRETYAPSWKKPLYVLINGGSRSGKEVVAAALKRYHAGTLVGERTAGAVMAGRAFLLSDGTLLYLAVQDALADGVRLEGAGVAPDVEVPDLLPYAAGRDDQLEKALSLAAGA
jgi:carboxyl-terminal processing protease